MRQKKHPLMLLSRKFNVFLFAIMSAAVCVTDEIG